MTKKEATKILKEVRKLLKPLSKTFYSINFWQGHGIRIQGRKKDIPFKFKSWEKETEFSLDTGINTSIDKKNNICWIVEFEQEEK